MKQDRISWLWIENELYKGTTVQELADACGTTYKNMWNRIRRHEVKDGTIYMKEEQLRPRKNAKKEKPAADPDNPKELLPVIKAEAIPEAATVPTDLPEECRKCNFFTVSREKAGVCFFRDMCTKYSPCITDPEPERMTVTIETFQVIEDRKKWYQSQLNKVKKEYDYLQKQFDSWAAILATIQPEEKPEISGGREDG